MLLLRADNQQASTTSGRPLWCRHLLSKQVEIPLQALLPSSHARRLTHRSFNMEKPTGIRQVASSPRAIYPSPEVDRTKTSYLTTFANPERARASRGCPKLKQSPRAHSSKQTACLRDRSILLHVQLNIQATQPMPCPRIECRNRQRSLRSAGRAPRRQRVPRDTPFSRQITFSLLDLFLEHPNDQLDPCPCSFKDQSQCRHHLRRALV